MKLMTNFFRKRGCPRDAAAQISNLLYRRLGAYVQPKLSPVSDGATLCRLQIGETADFKSAQRGAPCVERRRNSKESGLGGAVRLRSVLVKSGRSLFPSYSKEESVGVRNRTPAASHLFCVVAFLLLLLKPSWCLAQSAPDFSAVQGIFNQHCLSCHAAQDPEAKLVMRDLETLRKAPRAGPGMVPGE